MANKDAAAPSRRPAERPDVFLSYSRMDTEEARKIADALLASGFTVWFDKDIQAGSDWRDEIHRKMSRARCVVLYWSRRAEKSWWVAYEAFTAQQLGKLIITSFDDISVGSESWARDLQSVRLRRPLLKRFTETEQWKKLCADIEHKRRRLPRLRHMGWLGGGVVHKGGVTSVVFDPGDETTLLSCGTDGRAFFWNVAEAAPDLKYTRSTDQDDSIEEAALPPIHARFEPRAPETGAAWSLQRASFSPDGKRFILASEEGCAFLFKGRGFSQLVAELPHTKVVNPSYEGRRLPGQSKHAQGVVDASIAPDRILTLGADYACIWRPSDFSKPVTKQLPAGARGRSVDCLYSGAADAFYMTDRSGRIFALDASDALKGEVLPSRAAPGAVLGHSRELGLEGKAIASCSVSTSDRRIDVHEWKDGRYERVGDRNLRGDYPVRGLALHPDAPVVALAAGYRLALIAWDDSNRIELLSEIGGDHALPVNTVAVSNSGKYIATGGDDGCISIWVDETPRNLSTSNEG